MSSISVRRLRRYSLPAPSVKTAPNALAIDLRDYLGFGDTEKCDNGLRAKGT
jgi:hypothetical protein